MTANELSNLNMHKQQKKKAKKKASVSVFLSEVLTITHKAFHQPRGINLNRLKNCKL